MCKHKAVFRWKSPWKPRMPGARDINPNFSINSTAQTAQQDVGLGCAVPTTGSYSVSMDTFPSYQEIIWYARKYLILHPKADRIKLNVTAVLQLSYKQSLSWNAIPHFVIWSTTQTCNRVLLYSSSFPGEVCSVPYSGSVCNSLWMGWRQRSESLLERIKLGDTAQCGWAQNVPVPVPR